MQEPTSYFTQVGFIFSLDRVIVESNKFWSQSLSTGQFLLKLKLRGSGIGSFYSNHVWTSQFDFLVKSISIQTWGLNS